MITILATTHKNYEYQFMSSTAHKVSKASADKILKVLNEARYNLKSDTEIWHKYVIDMYDVSAFAWAEGQEFRIRKGKVTEHKH